LQLDGQDDGAAVAEQGNHVSVTGACGEHDLPAVVVYERERVAGEVAGFAG
jgi:hypothetical protein